MWQMDPHPPFPPPCQLIHQLTYWQTQTHTVHMFHTHVNQHTNHTTCAFSQQPRPFREQWPYWARGAFSCVCVEKKTAFWCILMTIFTFFSVEYHCTSNFEKTNVKKKKKIWITGLWITTHLKSWTHLQFLSECRAAPHSYFVSLLTFWKISACRFSNGNKKNMFCNIFMIENALLLSLFPVLFWIVNKKY